MGLSEIERQGRELIQFLETGEPEESAVPEKILGQHIAILGKTGSGKSYCAKGIAERLLIEGKRVCIIDPTGVWWGLRNASTGRGAGFPVLVFGGDKERCDLPLNHWQGEELAKIIGTGHVSAILNTRDLTIKQRTEFFANFAEALLRVNRGPLSLVIDEAHLFVPQSRPSDVASGRMLDAGNNLVSLGRGIGLRIVIISQRPAKISKDSLTQAEALIVLRLIAPQDRRAVEDWIGEWAQPEEGRELLRSLASLPTGEGWVWAPESGVLKYSQFPRIKTFDSSKAPDGKRRPMVIQPLASIEAMERLSEIEIRLESVVAPVEKRRRGGE
jgi:uncharacterized protein